MILLSADFYNGVSIKQPHYHDCHQILYVTGGSAQIRVNEAQYQVKAGDLVIFSRLEQHAVTGQSWDYQRYVLKIAPELPAGSEQTYRIYAILLNRPKGFYNVIDVQQQQEAVSSLFERILREWNDAQPMQEALLDLLVQQLLIYGYRRIPEVFSAMEDGGLELVQQIQTQFQRDYKNTITLHDLAQTYNISSSYLSHLFKKATGSSVMGYLQSCRIAAAKKYLAETNLRIGEIVEQCGFSDTSNFSRTFRSTTGLSPTDFRKKYQKSG